MYNEMVDLVVELKEKNHKRIYKYDIDDVFKDLSVSDSIMPLRQFVRDHMDNSDKLKKSKFPKKWRQRQIAAVTPSKQSKKLDIMLKIDWDDVNELRIWIIVMLV